MTISRETQICLEETSFYHCYVRCVRRAYLCGDDYSSGANYDHRKQWIVSRLKFLSYVYAIDICAYAVMSNHYHVVLHVDKARAESWSRTEVAERWMQLYSGDLLVSRWLKAPASIDDACRVAVYEKIETWRARLYDIGWFMRGVNETVARMANAEENCKGRFWEGRYKSQALLDDAALLSCMAYVDLNPVRAGMESDLESSDFTSVQQRLHEFLVKGRHQKNSVRQQKNNLAERIHKQDKLKTELDLQGQPEASLMPFDGSSHTSVHVALPFTLEDYFQLVENTGRVIHPDKRGAIADCVKPILDRYGVDSNQWLEHVRNFSGRYGRCAGSRVRIQSYIERYGLKSTKGVGSSVLVYQAV